MTKEYFKDQLSKYGITNKEAREMFGASYAMCSPSDYDPINRRPVPKDVEEKFNAFRRKETEATRYFRDLQRQLNRLNTGNGGSFVIRQHVEKLGLSMTEANAFFLDDKGNLRVKYKK